MLQTTFHTAANALANALKTQGWMCAVAESCTGGLLGAGLTALPGASNWFAGGIISYTNDVKAHLLGVNEQALRGHGSVSEPVVRQMAAGACKATGAQAAVSISGVAGPDGGTKEKPVGTVWIGVATPKGTAAFLHIFDGDRQAVREQARHAAVEHLLEAVRKGA